MAISDWSVQQLCDPNGHCILFIHCDKRIFLGQTVVGREGVAATDKKCRFRFIWDTSGAGIHGHRGVAERGKDS